MFSLKGKNAVVLGGAGVIGAALSRGLAEAGARVAIAGRTGEKAAAVARDLGREARSYSCDATKLDSLRETLASVQHDIGSIDILVNAVGGNLPGATTSADVSFFDLPETALHDAVSLNLFGGAILPAQIFGAAMAGNPEGGSIINITSMAGVRPLTRIVGYAAAKAAVSNFTQWLAVDLARGGYERLRVNAIAPGFFLTDQNRYLLINQDDGELTSRGQAIIEHTPAGRFGEPDDLIGAVVWLASDASRFVTGTVIPIDGGFSAFAGV